MDEHIVRSVRRTQSSNAISDSEKMYLITERKQRTDTPHRQMFMTSNRVGIPHARSMPSSMDVLNRDQSSIKIIRPPSPTGLPPSLLANVID